ncbi:MAG: B12-binding domain-containing radical SAM protein [Candidatus Cryosericum sp.]
MARVTLVYPDYTTTQLYSKPHQVRVDRGGWYAEGLAALSATLKQAGHSVSLVHLTQPPTHEDFVARLVATHPDVTGFSVRTSAFPSVSEWTGWAKDAVHTPIVWGGYHPSLAPEECMGVAGVDATLQGDGDLALPQLVDAWVTGRTPEGIPGVWWHDGQGLRHEPVGPLVANLDELPIPDFGLFDRSRLIATRTHTALAMLSRGCPYRCTYCTNHAFRSLYPNANEYHRARTPEGAIAYIQALRTWYPEVREFRFLDNVFGISTDWLTRFGEMYKREVGLPFACDHRAELLTEDTVRLLADMGCTQVYLGIESGYEELRRRALGRTMSNELLVQVIERLHTAGMRVFAYNMVGLPGETRATALLTPKLNAQARVDDACISVFSPYPSTVLYDVSVKEGSVKTPIDYTHLTFLDQPGFHSSEVAYMALSFNALRRWYERYGVDSRMGRWADRFVLSSRLPMRAIIAVTEHWEGDREMMKSFLRNRAPGVFLFLKRLLRGRVTPAPHVAAHGHQEGPPRA